MWAFTPLLVLIYLAAVPGKRYKTLEESKFAAQRIAFGAIMFQAARVLRNTGILAALQKNHQGLTTDEIVEKTGVSRYGVRVLTEAGLGMELLQLREDEKFALTKTGWILLNDELTRANMDFAHDICYQGMFHLDDAIKAGRPAGLQVFGEWETVYHALSSLPAPAKKSWLAFDHHYSDRVFGDVFPLIFDPPPAKLLDVGGNTGRWASHCLEADSQVQITIADLPTQVAMAKENFAQTPYAERMHYHPIDLLDPSPELPGGHDTIWMSQFLCCFSEEEVVSILERARKAMGEEARLFILDTYWDRQEHEMSSYCLQATSLYFTVLANGNSRMYRAQDILDCVAKAGLRVEEERDNLSLCHTLFRCVKA